MLKKLANLKPKISEHKTHLVSKTLVSNLYSFSNEALKLTILFIGIGDAFKNRDKSLDSSFEFKVEENTQKVLIVQW